MRPELRADVAEHSPHGCRGVSLPMSARVQGIALMCVAVFIFAVMNAIAKELGRSYSVVSIVWVRYAVPTLLIALIMGPRLRMELLRTNRLGLQLVRALLLVAATLLTFEGLRFLPLAEWTGISFVSPLLVAALSVPLLGERVEPRCWVSIAVGFLGVMIMVRPGSSVAGWPVLLPLCWALCYASYEMLTRRISGGARSVTTLFYTMAVGTVATSPLLPLVWRTPDPLDGCLMVGLGILGGIGHFALIKAFDRSPAATLAPFDYTKLVWATVLGLFLFGDFPDSWSLVGMTIVAASGLYVLFSLRHRGWPVGIEQS